MILLNVETVASLASVGGRLPKGALAPATAATPPRQLSRREASSRQLRRSSPPPPPPPPPSAYGREPEPSQSLLVSRADRAPFVPLASVASSSGKKYMHYCITVLGSRSACSKPVFFFGLLHAACFFLAAQSPVFFLFFCFFALHTANSYNLNLYAD